MANQDIYPSDLGCARVPDSRDESAESREIHAMREQNKLWYQTRIAKLGYGIAVLVLAVLLVKDIRDSIKTAGEDNRDRSPKHLKHNRDESSPAKMKETKQDEGRQPIDRHYMPREPERAPEEQIG